MRWSDAPIHFIDFEGNRASGILEFGVATLQGGAITAVRTRLCAAAGRIAAEESAVHGLTPQRLAGAAPFAEEWEYFARLRETGPLAAHFASAENHLLKGVWPYPRTAPDFARPGRTLAEWGPWIDTGRLAMQLLPQAGEAGLEQLVVACGLQKRLTELAAAWCPEGRRRYHAALHDALAAALLLEFMLGRDELSRATIPWLLQMSTLDADRRASLQQGDFFGEG